MVRTMTAQAPAVEAAALSIKPRPDGGFVLSDPLTGARVEVRREPGGRYAVAGESRLYCDALLRSSAKCGALAAARRRSNPRMSPLRSMLSKRRCLNRGRAVVV